MQSPLLSPYYDTSGHREDFSLIHNTHEGERLTGESLSNPDHFDTIDISDFSREVDRGFANIELQPLDPEQRNVNGHASGNLVAPLALRRHNTRVALSRHDGNRSVPPSLWTPHAIHWASITAFALSFIFLIEALEILNHFSRYDDGFHQANSKDYYLWTYGPTAVLSIIAAFWTQVEYRVKQLTPWTNLQGQPKSAVNSILLDYVSPWNVIVLFKSFWAGHYIVGITICVSLLIKLAIVFSTSLLILQGVTVDRISNKLTAQDKFDAGDFNVSLVEATAALTVAGVTLLNLSYPQGTTSIYAYQTFNLTSTSQSSITNLNATVDAFTADLDCQPARLRTYNQTCSGDVCYDFVIWMDVVAPNCTTNPFIGFNIDNGLLNQSAFYSKVTTASCIDAQSIDSQRLVITVASMNATNSSTFIDTSDTTFMALVCTPRYNISSFRVVSDVAGNLNSIEPIQPATPYQLPNFDSFDLVAGINASLVAAATQLALWPLDFDEFGFLDNFFILYQFIDPQKKVSKYFDEQYLTGISRRTFSALAAQLAKQQLTVPAANIFVGTADIYEQRLFVHQLPLRGMEATLGTIILMCALIAIFAPRQACSRDPGSLAGLSAIVARSQSLISTLHAAGGISSDVLNIGLHGRSYRSKIANDVDPPAFTVREVLPDPDNLTVVKPGVVIHWWRPFSVTTTARVLILSIPVALIVTLESVYQTSLHRNGFTNVKSEHLIRYVWIYIPVSVMLGVRAIFDIVDFSGRVFQPFHALRRGAESARNSMFDNYLAKLPIESLFVAMRRRHFAIASTSIFMFVAPTLTIVVSGLYYTAEVSTNSTVLAHQLDWFEAPGINASVSYMMKPNLVSSVLSQTDLSYPPWTVGELALAQISIDETKVLSVNSQSTFSAIVPAVRGIINCSLVPRDYIKQFHWEGSGSSAYLWMSTYAGKGCSGDDSGGDWANTTTMYLTNGSYFGNFITLPDQTIPSCPSLIAVYGQANGTSMDGITVATCSPLIQQVYVKTNFSLPDYQIISTNVDESSASLLTNQFSYSQLDFATLLPSPPSGSGDVYDNVFYSMIHGATKFKGHPIDSFMGANNFETFSKAFSDIYGLLYAQNLNLGYRVTGTPPVNAGSSVIQGTLTETNLVRLKQSAVSTRILEGLLAIMFICTASSFYFMKTDKVLPLNPCSIAAGASLVAGSEMLQSHIGLFPPGSEWLNDNECKKNMEFERRTLSMRWWPARNGSNGTAYRFGIDFDQDENEQRAPLDV